MAVAVRKCTDEEETGGARYDCLMRKLKTDSDYLMGKGVFLVTMVTTIMGSWLLWFLWLPK